MLGKKKIEAYCWDKVIDKKQLQGGGIYLDSLFERIQSTRAGKGSEAKAGGPL